MRIFSNTYGQETWIFIIKIIVYVLFWSHDPPNHVILYFFPVPQSWSCALLTVSFETLANKSKGSLSHLHVKEPDQSTE